MPSKYYNPFQTLELRYPEELREAVTRYTQRWEAGKESDPEEAPFPRYIDMWFLAVCVGAQMGKRQPITRETSHKFIEGSIFQSDPWRVELLELLAIGFTGDPQVIRNPRDVIQLANELAAAGMPQVIEMLHEGRAQPIWNLSQQVLEKLGVRQTPDEEDGPTVQDAAELSLSELIAQDESKRLEFKASLQYDLEKRNVSKEVRKSIAKAVAAFLNTDGGTLVIGVHNSKEILGIANDLKTLGSKGDLDNFELTFRNVIREYLPAEFGPLVEMKFAEQDGKTVAIVQCQGAPKEVFFTDGKEVTFYVRSGNSSQPLNPRAALEYIKAHWRSAG